MNHEEAWNELKDRLNKAKLDVNQMADNLSETDNHYFRLLGKGNGISLALEYIREIESSIEQPVQDINFTDSVTQSPASTEKLSRNFFIAYANHTRRTEEEALLEINPE